jgi:hypothetical protein
MNTLYHKVAVASVCTALSFALVANKEAKAASFTLQPSTAYTLGDTNGQDGVADTIFGGASLPVGIINGQGYRHQYRVSYEFNLGNLSLDPNTISRVLFRVDSNTISSYARFSRLDAYGYTGNGQAEVSDFGAGEFLGGRFLYSEFLNPIPGIKPYFVFDDVLPFISQSIKNNDTFVGFSLRVDDAYLTLNQNASLTIITADVAEPVPEPTTILTAAVALGWGGWLKRKKSSQQNKTTPQA